MSARTLETRWTQTLAGAVAQAGLFLAVYRGCLVLTAGRSDVGQHFSNWELNIPLVPAMIVPYFSIYLLFFVGFFACRSARELGALFARLSISQVVAAACYLLFPLKTAFERPVVEGFFGPMFRLLEATDLPYNLAPSLHVTTAIILGSVLVRRTHGWLRGVTVAWFGLIALSTMLTWQHHLVDVVAGGLLGLSCILPRPLTAAFPRGRACPSMAR